MPITVSGDPEAGAATWEDLSGGYLVLSLAHSSYTSHHRFRVIPFDTAGTGNFLSPPAASTTSIQQEMDNLISLITAMYPGAVNGGFTRVYQTFDPVLGAAPYPFSFGVGSSFGSGSASGAALPTAVVLNITTTSKQGGRVRWTFPGLADSQISGTPQKVIQSGYTGAIKAFMDYVTDVTNGPVHAVHSNLVAHDGQSPIAGAFGIVMDNKRLRRRLGLV